MPIVGIKDCRGGAPKSGIPVRQPPQNICDVNPYVCRMTPASIEFKTDPPFVSKLSFEPHPRGCQCCAKAAQRERESYRRVSQTYQPGRSRPSQSYQTPANTSLGYSPPITPQHEDARRWTQQDCTPPREQSRSSPQPSTNRVSPPAMSPDPEPRPSEQLNKKQRKMQAKNQKKLAKMERKREQRLFKQQKKLSAASNRSADYEQVRLLREQKRRDDFVTACCTGLLLTPCASAGSCSEEADEREQANFYIQCKCCSAGRDPCEHKEETKKNKKRADFPCRCRNCKYQNNKCTNRRTGCLEQETTESPVCYCTGDEKLDNRPYRVCDEEPVTKTARAGQRGFHTQGDGAVCEEMMPTKAALLTCTKRDGETCTKMVMTAEMMQEMLIKQAREGVQLANSLLTNRKFQLVDVTAPQDRNEQRSPLVGTSGSNRSVQPVDMNDPNLTCYLENINPPVLPATGQIPLVEPLPRPPLNPYQSEPHQDNYNVNSMGEAYNPTPQYRQPEDPTRTSSYLGSTGSAKQSKAVPHVPSNQRANPRSETYQLPLPFQQSQERLNFPSSQTVEPARQKMGEPNGITGHICIPRDAFLQDPTNQKLCIPLKFDPRLSTSWGNCPFVNDHAAGVSVIPETDFAATSAQRVLRKGDSRQKLTQGSQQSLHGSQRGLRNEQASLPAGLRQHGSEQGLAEGSGQGVHKQDSRSALQTETSKPGVGPTLRDSSGRNLQEKSSKKIRSSKDPDRRRKDSDREQLKRDSDRRKRESDRRKRGDPERRKFEPRKRESLDDGVQKDKGRRKRSVSPCLDSDGSLRGSGKRRPSPSEMVRTLNGYETDLLQAMDKVKSKYMIKRGNETSSSRGTSSFDSMTPGLAEFNCLLKHITCLRKELKKYTKDDVG